MRAILNSDDAIEAYADAHCTLIRAAGVEPTEKHRQSYKEALRALTKLARNEYAIGMAQDINQANAALKD